MDSKEKVFVCKKNRGNIIEELEEDLTSNENTTEEIAEPQNEELPQEVVNEVAVSVSDDEKVEETQEVVSNQEVVPAKKKPVPVSN